MCKVHLVPVLSDVAVARRVFVKDGYDDCTPRALFDVIKSRRSAGLQYSLEHLRDMSNSEVARLNASIEEDVCAKLTRLHALSAALSDCNGSYGPEDDPFVLAQLEGRLEETKNALVIIASRQLNLTRLGVPVEPGYSFEQYQEAERIHAEAQRLLVLLRKGGGK